MKCPIDGATLIMSERHGVEIDYCPECRGVWLDRGELDKIIEQAAGPVVLDDPAPEPRPAPRPRQERPPERGPERGNDRRDDRKAEAPRVWQEPYRPERRDDDWYDDDDDRRDRKSRGKPYRKYKKKRRKSFLEELFDFD